MFNKSQIFGVLRKAFPLVTQLNYIEWKTKFLKFTFGVFEWKTLDIATLGSYVNMVETSNSS